MRLMQYAGAQVMGGLLAHVVILSRALVQAGHQVHAVLPPVPEVDEAARDIEDACARVSRLTVRGKADLRGMSRLRALVRRERPDLLHVHLSSPIESVPAILSAGIGTGCRIVTTEHAPTWFPLERAHSRAAKRLAGGAIDAVVAVCESDKRFLVDEFGVPADRIVVIPNGVPNAAAPQLERAAARERLGLDATKNHFLVGYAGALEAKKGVPDLLAAIESCGVQNVAVAMAGEGSLLAELRLRARGSGFPLLLPGRLPGIGWFLRALDLFVLPSHQEAMPIALLEAMMAGLPIVATRVGGVAEAIRDQQTGILVEAGRTDQLAAAVATLAGEPARARRLGDAARARAAEEFTAERMARRVESLYGSILAGAAKRRA